MRVYSVFTQLLEELTRYSKKNDMATSNLKDLSKVNDLEEQIVKCYHNGYYSFSEYRLLNELCAQIKMTMRDVIRTNTQVKAIEKNIRETRRKFAQYFY